MYRSSRCGLILDCDQIRCTVDLLNPNAAAILGHDQCVLPSTGFCVVLRKTFACTASVTLRGLLPLCRPSRPAMPLFSNRAFHRAIVGREVFSSTSIRL
jgi:hypothetical protein